jgi:hypothetical protein
MYDNQNEVDAVAKRLQEIDPSLRLGSFTLDGNRVVAVGICITEKGNKPIINKLLEIGFKKVWREKVAGYLAQYEGYSFRVRMEMRI